MSDTTTRTRRTHREKAVLEFQAERTRKQEQLQRADQAIAAAHALIRRNREAGGKLNDMLQRRMAASETVSSEIAELDTLIAQTKGEQAHA